MKPRFMDKAKLWWLNVRERFLWSIVKRCVQRIDQMNCGAFLAFSWAIDEVTDYHVIAERSYPDCHVFGTKVTWYDADQPKEDA